VCADDFAMPATTQNQGLAPRTERLLQRASSLAVMVLAVGAAVLSFSGLQDLAISAGFSPLVAWLLPVIVDGMVLTGSLGVVASGLAGIGTWYSWLLTLLGVVVSVWGNVAAAPSDLVSQLVHAIAPVTFALSVEGMVRIYRASAHASAEREERAEQAEERRLEREARSQERILKAQIAAETAKAAAAPVMAPLRVVQPRAATTAAQPAPGTARAQIAAYLIDYPDASGGAVARALNLDPSYTRKILRDLRPGISSEPDAAGEVLAPTAE
jgi:hypothetical protein